MKGRITTQVTMSKPRNTSIYLGCRKFHTLNLAYLSIDYGYGIDFIRENELIGNWEGNKLLDKLAVEWVLTETKVDVQTIA